MNGTDRLVLFSGGMDSTIALYHALGAARREGSRVHTISFSYGQRHSYELGFARTIIGRLAKDDMYGHCVGKHVTQKLHFPLIPGSLIGGEPVTKYANIEEANEMGDLDTAFIPYRNLVMLTNAAVYSWLWRAPIMVTGLRGGFADCTEEYENVVEQTLRASFPDWPIVISTPTHKSREQCIRDAQKLPGCMEALAGTMTCFEGTTPACGYCLPCLKRAEGFKKAGVPDPAAKPPESAQGPIPLHTPPQ